MLITLLVLTLIVAAANWWSRWTDDDRLELWSKPLATMLVIGVAVTAGASGNESTVVVVLTVVALVACLAGDVLLMPQIDNFVGGLAAFLLGHLLFVVALAAAGLDRPWLALVAAVLVGPAVAVVGRRILSGARAGDPALVGPVTAYLTIISSMLLVAWASGRVSAIIGATLFVTSDSILGWRKFVGERRWMSVAIMVTYHGALVGLALSIA